MTAAAPGTPAPPGDDGEAQATVVDWDPVQGGSVVLDDGLELSVPAAALQAPLRSLRSGQRVRVRVRAGRGTAVTLWTLPWPPSTASHPAGPLSGASQPLPGRTVVKPAGP